MYEPEYSPVEQKTPTSASWAHHSNESSASLLGSEDHHVPAYVRNPIITYASLLSFFIIVPLVPVAFVAILLTRDGLPAPRLIADFAISNPRLTPQITTILSSFLTSSVKWALAGVVTIRAQKHFLHTRRSYKIEVFSALKNNGIAWSWKRKWLMFWTWVVVLLCGLLTSGFVALISPFPINRGTDITSGSLEEMDFSSSNPVCTRWHDNVTLTPGGQNDCPAPHRYKDSDFVYTNCRNVDFVGDFFNAAKSSMIYQFIYQFPASRASNIAQSFAQLANTRLIGSTAGALPIGPAGVNVFPKSNFSLGSTTSSSYNYTLELQGIWAEATCSYTDNSQLVASVKDGETSYIISCQSNYTAVQWTTTVGQNTKVGAIVGGLCYSHLNDNFDFHLRSFWTREDGGTPPDRVYAGINAMNCSLAPRVGLVNAAYRSDLTAFHITPPSSGFTPFPAMANLTKDLVVEAMRSTLIAIDWGQTTRFGNIFGTAVSSTAMMYGDVTGQQQAPIIPSLVAAALKGIFEYKITNQRVIASARAGSELDPSCRRGVTGRLAERIIGWELRRSTILGLIPLFIISVACLGVTVWTMLRKNKLTVFDPTNPVSLLAAASDGKLRFSDGKEATLIGDPEDEFVLTTKVRYEYRDGGWGLRRKTD